jgi:ATP/ADP translocase
MGTSMQQRRSVWFLSKLQVRPEEQQLFVLLAAAIFVIQLVDGIIDVRSVAGFVGNAGVDQVPYLALLQGMALLLFSNPFALLVDHWPKPRLLPVALVVYALALCVVRVLIAWEQLPFAAYASLYVIRWQMLFLISIVFWTIVSDTFTFASANRLVPLIGAAGFLGTIAGTTLGGASGQMLVQSGLHPDDVLWIAAATLAISAWAVWWLGRKGILRGAVSASANKSSSMSLRKTLWQAPRFVQHTRIFRVLAVIIFLSAVGFYLILYAFLALGKATHADNLDFQRFYGNVQAAQQVTILALQLFANRFFVRQGAARLLLGLPLVLIGGGLLLALVPGLWVGILVICANDIYFLVFQQPSVDVLFGLVPPQIKGRVKTVLETFVRSVGYIASGGLLLLVQFLWSNTFELAIGAMLVACGLIALVTVVLLVRRYSSFLQDWQLARRKRQISDVL